MHAKKLILYCSLLFILSSTTSIVAESYLIDIPNNDLLDLYLEDNTENEVISNTKKITASNIIEETKNNNSASKSFENAKKSELGVMQIEDEDDEKVSSISLQTVNDDYLAPARLYCHENPSSQECLYSEYLSFCKKDPQALSCRHQLEQFYNFCISFPRSHKCKNAQLFAPCKREPNSNECKMLKERWCQKSSDAIFCG